MPTKFPLKGAVPAALIVLLAATAASAQSWDRPAASDLPPVPTEPYPSTPAPRAARYRGVNDAYRPPGDGYGSGGAAPGRPASDAYSPPPRAAAPAGSADYGYGPAPAPGPAPGGGYAADGRSAPPPGYGAPYEPPREADGGGYGTGGYGPGGYDASRPPPPRDRYSEDRGVDGGYSKNEVLETGHRFFGSVSQGLASAVEYVFQQAGRPNGYILGEDAGGAFVAGLRYGEGTLYTKDAGNHRVYWQGPSLGYDFGGEGSKTMVLVYNLRDPAEIYNRFGGIQGSAYLVGGVSVQFQKYGDVVLAPIRSGVGLRLGANVGYLKYTRAPTWNPF